MSIALPIFSHYPAIPPPAAIPLSEQEEHACPYLPGRMARSRAAWAAGRLAPAGYHELMDAGFRRSGRLIYQHTCRACRACIPIRVPTGIFAPSKSQRRVVRRNADLVVRCGPARPHEETYTLYRSYMSGWHDRHGDDDLSPESFERFLYDSPVQTLEFTYRDGAGKLVAVGLCDVCDASLSSVYFFFDPAECRRGLGVFGALYEIQFARSRTIPFYYLGYWIAGCGTMDYKAGYTPHELLGTDGVWRPNCRTPAPEVGLNV